jgi:hypothetical protein
MWAEILNFGTYPGVPDYSLPPVKSINHYQTIYNDTANDQRLYSGKQGPFSG